jgi:maltooligosyltrehalose trehalohydrolase
MQRGEMGYWTALVPQLATGTQYGYALDGGAKLYPDPASRFQPSGPHGLSELIDPGTYQWSDADWPGLKPAGQVLYEMHVGTFTPEGTWDAARAKLPQLAALGITAVEVMQIADFPGRFGWGYDGVDLYAPQHNYGRPDDLRAFVDAAHRLGIGVILDVVYNHLGPDGNYLREFCPRYFSERDTEWGAAFNYDGRDSRPVRDFIAGNAEYWIRDYHMDGLRIDATQSMFDASEEHILAEVTRRARAAAGDRSILIIAEYEPQQSELVRTPAQGGYGLDLVWNDDFHHSATVALVGNREGYYTDYLGRANEFVAAMKHGYLFQGQRYAWQQKRRGTPTFGIAPRQFVAFLENHDQVANTPTGERLRSHAHPSAHRAMTAMLLLGPWTPMLFQGGEWASEQPFTFFADFDGELGEAVQRGRRNAFKQFPSYAKRVVQESIPSPGDLATFQNCKLDWSEAPHSRAGQQLLALHRDLIALRRDDPTLRACIMASDRNQFDAAVLTDHALVLRYFGARAGDRLIVINLGPDLELTAAPEPLLAPPLRQAWCRTWSSEDPRYGGTVAADQSTDVNGWRLPGYCTMLFVPIDESQHGLR